MARLREGVVPGDPAAMESHGTGGADVKYGLANNFKAGGLQIKGGIVEGEAYLGSAAEVIADLPDRNTVNTQIVTAISGPARSLASVLNAVAGGLARCIQARVDKASAE